MMIAWTNKVETLALMITNKMKKIQNVIIIRNTMIWTLSKVIRTEKYLNFLIQSWNMFDLLF